MCVNSFFFFFNDTATTEIYTLSLHDALPIWSRAHSAVPRWHARDPQRSAPRRRRRRRRASARGREPAVRRAIWREPSASRSEEHTSELQSLRPLVCRLLLEKKKKHIWPASIR